jgi:hypothetical protein
MNCHLTTDTNNKENQKCELHSLLEAPGTQKGSLIWLSTLVSMQGQKILEGLSSESGNIFQVHCAKL